MVGRNGGEILGAPQGSFRWRAVTATPELEAEGFLGLEELVMDEPAEQKPKTKKRKREKEETQKNKETGDLADTITINKAAKTSKNQQQQQHQQQQQDAAADAPSTPKKQKRKKHTTAAPATSAAAPTAADESKSSNNKSALKPLPGIGGPTAAEAAAAAPTAAAAAAAAFECMYDSYEMVPELDEGLALWKPHLNNDICVLHPAVSRVLLQLQLLRPTPVQQEVLLQAVRDRKDVVAAAQTGSGKTLAFALPIVSSLASQLARRLEKWQERLAKQREEQEQLNNVQEEEETDDETKKQQFLLQQLHPEGPAALVLEPTRELALQVLHVVQQLCTYTPIRVAAVVGGLSPEKQLRVLGSSKPLILVATPGRLLALQREQQPAATATATTAGEDIEELRQQEQQQQLVLQQQGRKERLAREGLAFAKDFSLLQFLVLDEADRLLLQQQQHHREKKKKQKKNKHRRVALPPTETEELLQLLYAQLDAAPPKGSNHGSSINTNNISNQSISNNNSKRKKQQKQQKIPGKLRGRAASLQTFVLSATLSLALQRKQQGLQLVNSSSSYSSNSNKEEEEGTAAAAALLQHVRIRAKALLAVKVTDEQQQAHVWQQHQQQQQQQQQQEPQQQEQQEESEEGQVVLQHPSNKLPATLRLSVWKCAVETEMEVHLAAYLLRIFDLKSQQQKPLKADRVRLLLFLRVGCCSLLLKEQLQQRHREEIDVCGLHSNLQQKQRLKRLDRFSRSKYGLLVSTDVAARGVDFKNVEKVVNFQRPRDAETLIHRCGRTARAGRDGEALCFISSEAAGQWETLLAAAGIELASSPPPLGFRDVAAFVENIEPMKRLFQLADEIEQKDHAETKRKRTMGAMRRMALAADVELESDVSGSEGEEEINTKMRMKNEHARKKLRQILATYVP